MDNAKFRDNAPAIKRALRRGIRNATKDVADRIVERAIELCPISKDGGGGNLQRSIDAKKPVTRKDSVECEFGAYAPYAASVEYGTAGMGEPVGSSYNSPTGATDWPSVPPGKKRYEPYEIRPRRRKALHWKDGNGNDVFRKKVIHPGVRARPFMRPAVDLVRHQEAERIISDAVNGELQKAVSRTGGVD